MGIFIIMKYIITEDKLNKLFFNYINSLENLQTLLIDKSESFWTFTTKLEWDNRYEKSPIVFNYFFYPSKLDIGPFWSNKKNYPILNIDPNLYDTLEGLFGDRVNKLIPEWFEQKFNLPVRTFNYEFL